MRGVGKRGRAGARVGGTGRRPCRRKRQKWLRRALTAQAVQVDEPAGAAKPAAQATHWLGSVAPAPERAVPAAQLVQLGAPWSEYEPGRHEEQVEAPAAEKEPAAQIEHPVALDVPPFATVPL